MAMKKYGYGGAKKRLPKGQKGLAKMTRLVKAAGKGKGTPGRKSGSKAPMRRKMESTAAAKKSLTRSGLKSTGANMRSKLNEALKIASGLSRAKGSGKVAPLKKSSTKLAGFGMQKGGAIGKLTPGMKKVLKKTVKKADKSMMPPGMPRTTKDLKKATRMLKKAKGAGKAKITRPIPGGKNLPSKRSGTQLKKAQKGRIITSKSGLKTKVNRKGVAKKNQGAGRPISAKKAVRKITKSLDGAKVNKPKMPKLRGRTITSPSGLTQRVTRKGAVKKNQGGGRAKPAKKLISKYAKTIKRK